MPRRSPREWTAKLGIVREEADEALCWLIFVERSGMAPGQRTELEALIDEARQLTRIFAASYRTSKNRG